MKKTQLAIALGLVSSSVLVGCGDDSTEAVSDTTTPTVNYSVTAIDGYLQNAQVWLDINGNYQLDEGEPSTLSGEGGVANLNVTEVENPQQYPVVVQALAGKTIDIGDDVAAPENKVVKTSYMMSAPAGETDVTPLSTLVHVVLEQNVANASPQGSELTEEEVAALKAEAISQVAEQLGIANDEVLGDFIEDDNNAVAFAAESVVAAQILPETPQELSQVVEEVKSDDPDDAKTKSTFLATTEAATNEIKTTIETAVDKAGSEDDVDFSAVDPVFSESDDTSDTDGDGVPNHLDAFDNDKDEWVDTDKDGIGNNTDTDDDGDGVLDTEDAFPLNPDESVDTDGDFIGNEADTDDDGDGVLDTADAFPLDKTETLDTDGDKIGDNADTDDDGDGVIDTEDAFPLDETETLDTDGDKIGDNADNDDDGDGVIDTEDAFPLDKTETLDTDGDKIGNNADTDDDGDDVIDTEDAFPLDETETVDTDGDKIGNNADTDDDNDGVIDTEDAFPLDETESSDRDGDKVGDNADAFPDDPTKSVIDSATAEIMQFLKDAGTLYSLWENDFNQLFVETITVNGDLATMTAVGRVQPDKTLASLPVNYDMDVQLTSTGWALPDGYTIDMTSGELKAYPGSDSTYSYTLSGNIVDLVGKVIATSTPDWDKFADTTAIFAPGSKLAEFTLTADTTMYYLWDNSPWVMRSDAGHDTDGANATSLDELISPASVGDKAIGETSPADTMVTTSVAYEISVEFVTGSVANFYTFDWNTDTATKIGEGTWERDGNLPADMIAYTITPGMIEQFNATKSGVWPGEPEEQHKILSVYEGKVRNGEFEPAGTVDDDGFTLYTQTAKEDVLSQAVIACSLDSTEVWDPDTFLERVSAYQQCAGTTLPAVTAEDIKTLVIHKLNTEGEYRAYYFHPDGTLTYDKNGGERPRTWTLEKIDGIDVISQKSEDGSELIDQMVLVARQGNELTFAYYWLGDNESTERVFTDVSYASSLTDCNTGNSAWDDEKDQPTLPYSTTADYDTAVASCTDTAGTFTADMLTNSSASAVWMIGDMHERNGTTALYPDENIRFNADGTGAFIDAEDGEFPFNWAINNGVLSLDITHPTYDANQEVWTLLAQDDVNGYYSVKAFYQDFTEWVPTPAANEGEVWSFVMKPAD